MPIKVEIILGKTNEEGILHFEEIDGTTLPYSEANLTTLLTGVTNPVYALKRIDNTGNAYPSTYQARNEAEFKTVNFDTVWNVLIANPDIAFKL